MDYIKAHINDYPRKEVAKAAGVTLHTLYKYITILGGTKIDNKLNKNLKDILNTKKEIDKIKKEIVKNKEKNKDIEIRKNYIVLEKRVLLVEKKIAEWENSSE